MFQQALGASDGILYDGKPWKDGVLMTKRSTIYGLIYMAALLASLIMTALPATAGPQGTLQDVTPHKALYDIEMISRRSGSSVLNISGQMYFEWQKKCDAWTTDHRFKLSYEYADSPPMDITSDFSTYEPFDGKSLDFSSRRWRNDTLYEELRGQATINEDGVGKAVYSLPPSLQFDLPAGTIFPAAHTGEMLHHMKNKTAFYKATVFDGSDEEGPIEINSFINPKTATATTRKNKHIDVSLTKVPSRNVRMAFFPLLHYETSADYEMSATLHENGVISHMTIDYKDFSIEQKLTALETLEISTCPDQKTISVTPEKNAPSIDNPAESR